MMITTLKQLHYAIATTGEGSLGSVQEAFVFDEEIDIITFNTARLLLSHNVLVL